ncbi:atrial natriuretic peptide receptor 3 [Periophthalmus magnuspinnatus]|uniref:atrial natriuretic peptide receptor 3 n=1 Tax=Periophthalmus magnuspinnatus TaxID=409849 RepID=UPI00145A643D|nr:atrial natriuretic peptide receptor 3 [Periophthalmus magnuspinnatus]
MLLGRVHSQVLTARTHRARFAVRLKMRSNAVLAYFVAVLSVVLLTPCVCEDVDVLVFLPQNNSYLFSRARVAPAILYAQQRLKAHGGPLSEMNFNIDFDQSDCVNAALFSLVDRSCTRRPDVILGPVCEYEAAAVVRLASHWHIPVISAGALATAFSDKSSEYSHLTRIAPSYVKMAETFSAMFEHFSWSSALLIYEDDRQERNCYFTLEGVYHLMSGFNVKTYQVYEGERLDTEDVVQSISDTEVVIMCMGADQIRNVMLAAHRHSLTNGSYMFFNIELFNASSYGDGWWRRDDAHDAEAMQAYSSLNTLTLLKSSKPQFENFTLEMRGALRRAGLHDSINLFMEGFHDALLLYAIALQEALQRGHSKSNALEITSRMWNRTFEGIAGPVSIDANGDRDGDFSLMSMTDTEAGTFETVASYFGENGTFQMLPTFNREHFTLRGRVRPLPDTPDKSCGLGVSALTGVIVGAVLGITLLVAFFFLRKNFKITIERRTHRDQCEVGKRRQLREDSIRSSYSAS